MNKEKTLSKITLLLVRDWDGFQAAMRRNVTHSERRGN